jgi:hypothetical protein
VGGGGGGEREKEDEIQYKKCVHICISSKMIPVETIPGMGEKR